MEVFFFTFPVLASEIHLHTGKNFYIMINGREVQSAFYNSIWKWQ